MSKKLGLLALHCNSWFSHAVFFAHSQHLASDHLDLSCVFGKVVLHASTFAQILAFVEAVTARPLHWRHTLFIHNSLAVFFSRFRYYIFLAWGRQQRGRCSRHSSLRRWRALSPTTTARVISSSFQVYRPTFFIENSAVCIGDGWSGSSWLMLCIS